MIKFLLFWALSGVLIRFIRGRGRWGRMMIIGPVFAILWISEWIYERKRRRIADAVRLNSHW